MVVPIRYSYISWTPPHLSPQEELELGKRIALVGRTQFENEFRESIFNPPKRTPAPRTGSAAWPQEVRYTIGIILFGGIFLFLAKAGLANEFLISVIPILIVVAIVYYGSVFFAVRRFNNWVNYLIANYAKHTALQDAPPTSLRGSVNAGSTSSTAGLPTIDGRANAVEYFERGLRYATGQGVAQDYSQAMKWYLKAATTGSGLAEAQTNLGTMYSNGQGVKQDYVESAKWFLKAAEQGEPVAQYNIGLFYAQGLGVAQDYSEAVKWSRKSAEQGNPGAQNNLAVFYLKGLGVPQNEQEGLSLLRRAAAGGFATAIETLKSLEVDENDTQASDPSILVQKPQIEKVFDSHSGLVRYKHRESKVTSFDGRFRTEELRIRTTIAVQPNVSFEDASEKSLSFKADIRDAQRGTHYDGIIGVNGVVSDFGNEYLFPQDGSSIYVNITKTDTRHS